MITQSRVKELLKYIPDTGQFIRLLSTNGRVKVGDVAGSLKPNGYIQIRINDKLYLAHRLAWLYVYGYFPKNLDHINGIRNDNRISNLRECTNHENQQNRTSGKNSSSKYIGVTWYKSRNKWLARIMVNGRQNHLGYFALEQDAFTAYCNAKKSLHDFNPVPRKI